MSDDPVKPRSLAQVLREFAEEPDLTLHPDEDDYSRPDLEKFSGPRGYGPDDLPLHPDEDDAQGIPHGAAFTAEEDFRKQFAKEFAAKVTAVDKFDTGKPRYELIAPEFLDGIARVLTFGARKYEERNWEKGLAYSRFYGALQRHLWAWWAGENEDVETNESHLYHAACCLMFLATYEDRWMEELDDRPKNPGA